MTNLLRHRLPTTVEYQGISYPIDYRFNTILKIFALLNDDLFTEEDRLKRAINLFYSDTRPEDTYTAVYLMLQFMSDDECLSESDDKCKPQLLSFEKDANMIYSYFLRVYHIDLQEEHIHWYKFKALIQDVGDTPLLSNIIDIRSTDPSSIPIEKRSKFLAIQRQFSINPTQIPRTLEERNKQWLMDT